MRIDATGLHYRELNQQIRTAVEAGETAFELDNVCGHRYVGCGIGASVDISINGIPGNDLASFMSGPRVWCSGNAQDAIANTMSDGLVVVPGHAGDVLGYSMRGGCVYVRGNAGYRIGIHMKSFEECQPVVIVGGRVRDYCGEYLAGGTIIVLGLDVPHGEPIVGRYTATGMHGGAVYVRGEVAEDRVRRGVSLAQVSDDEQPYLRELLDPYCDTFGLSVDDVLSAPFTRITAHSTCPYGQLYAY